MTFIASAPVRFPSAVATVRAFLKPYFPNVRIASRVPDPRPATWIRVIRTGGARESRFVDRPQITLEAWAADETAAEKLLEDARAVLNAAEGIIFGVEELSGPGELPDPTTASIRYTMSLWIRLRGEAMTGTN